MRFVVSSPERSTLNGMPGCRGGKCPPDNYHFWLASQWRVCRSPTETGQSIAHKFRLVVVSQSVEPVCRWPSQLHERTDSRYVINCTQAFRDAANDNVPGAPCSASFPELARRVTTAIGKDGPSSRQQQQQQPRCFIANP